MQPACRWGSIRLSCQPIRCIDDFFSLIEPRLINAVSRDINIQNESLSMQGLYLGRVINKTYFRLLNSGRINEDSIEFRNKALIANHRAFKQFLLHVGATHFSVCVPMPLPTRCKTADDASVCRSFEHKPEVQMTGVETNGLSCFTAVLDLFWS